MYQVCFCASNVLLWHTCHTVHTYVCIVSHHVIKSLPHPSCLIQCVGCLISTEGLVCVTEPGNLLIERQVTYRYVSWPVSWHLDKPFTPCSSTITTTRWRRYCFDDLLYLELRHRDPTCAGCSLLFLFYSLCLNTVDNRSCYLLVTYCCLVAMALSHKITASHGTVWKRQRWVGLNTENWDSATLCSPLTCTVCSPLLLDWLIWTLYLACLASTWPFFF